MIRVSEVRLIGADGQQVGVIPTREALQIAETEGLDLVEIAPNASPPVCKVMDYGKFQYEKSKKEKEAKKKQTKIVVKEIKFRPDIGDHDYDYRVRHAKEFLGKRFKVRDTVTFRGRQMEHTHLGREILKKLAEELSEIAEVESSPKMESRSMFAIFAPKSNK